MLKLACYPAIMLALAMALGYSPMPHVAWVALRASSQVMHANLDPTVNRAALHVFVWAARERLADQ